MKGDLDKDGVLNEYERNRKDAIDASIEEQERESKQTGGSIDDQMKQAMGIEMVPDEQMENQYMNFILEEALTEEEAVSYTHLRAHET